MKRSKEMLNEYPVLFRTISSVWSVVKKIPVWLRLSGARCIRIDDFENGVLILNRNSSLGRKGAIVYTPQDNTIFKFVVEHGEWEIDESQFLADRLIRDVKPSERKLKPVFIDIGANAGLVTRQVLNLSRSDCDVVLVEPIPNHVKAIRANLEKFNPENNFVIGCKGARPQSVRDAHALPTKSGVLLRWTQPNRRVFARPPAPRTNRGAPEGPTPPGGIWGPLRETVPVPGVA
jgi:hypothetical protein